MKVTDEQQSHLQEIANNARRWIISMLAESGSGHPGGSLSVIDILVALYEQVLHIDPHNPGMPDRDRLVMSKGHAAPALYTILALQGFFPKTELMNLRKINSMLQGHPDMKNTPGVDMSTGSLGQGLSAANGMALAARLDSSTRRIYAILGDGELQEGQVWEAAMTSAHYHLNNLTAFIDHNGLQIDGPVAEVMSPEPIADKWKAFGWEVMVIDGHDFKQIINAVNMALQIKDKPQMIIAETVKGKGVSFMEGKADWHGAAPSNEQAREALAELGGDPQ